MVAKVGRIPVGLRSQGLVADRIVLVCWRGWLIVPGLIHLGYIARRDVNERLMLPNHDVTDKHLLAFGLH